MYQFFYSTAKIPLILAFGLWSFVASAQTIDSLKAVLPGKTDSERFEILFSISREYVTSDLQQASNYVDQANQLAFNLGDSLKIVRSLRLKAQIGRRLDKLDEAIKIFEKALSIAQRHKTEEGYLNEIKFILNGLAITHTFLANYDKALEEHFQSLVIREKEGDKAQISYTLNNIGLVYFKLKNYERANEYFSRSLTFRREAKDSYDMDRLLINLGMTNIHLKNYQNALDYIDQGLKFCDRACNDDVVVEGEFGRGVANYGLEKIDVAEFHFMKSLEVSKTSDNKRFQAENLVYLGRVQSKKSDFNKAKSFLEESEKIAGASGYNQLLIDTYKELSKLYNANKDFQNASIYQDKYISLKDSLIGENLVKNIAKIQTNFEQRINIATIAEKEEDLARQRNLNIAIGLIAVLAGLLVFVLYRSNSITRRVNSALSDAKAVIETQNHRLQNINRELDAKVKEKTADLQKANEDLDKANKALVRVNDELDNFIYKTSHDIRGPLASLKGICSVALMDVKDPLALDYLTKLDVSSGRLNVILTRLLIVNQINHAIVGREQIDFNNIVDDVLLLEKKKGLPERLEVRREIDNDINFLSDKDLVRIILENLIDNSIKFYNDSERIQPFVHIKIGLQNDTDVVVSVIDNGIGIAEAKPDKIFQMFSRASERSGTGGIGLYLSKLATEKLGGQINLRSTAEGYTEFYVSFPLEMQTS